MTEIKLASDSDAAENVSLVSSASQPLVARAPFEIQFFSDAGHGWAKVPRSLLAELGILLQISNYSYERDGFVFCEEDYDLSILCNALRAGGKEPKFIEHHSGGQSQIRGYQKFKRTSSEMGA